MSVLRSFRAGFTLYMVNIIEIYSVKPGERTRGVRSRVTRLGVWPILGRGVILQFPLKVAEHFLNKGPGEELEPA